MQFEAYTSKSAPFNCLSVIFKRIAMFSSNSDSQYYVQLIQQIFCIISIFVIRDYFFLLNCVLSIGNLICFKYKCFMYFNMITVESIIRILIFQPRPYQIVACNNYKQSNPKVTSPSDQCAKYPVTPNIRIIISCIT